MNKLSQFFDHLHTVFELVPNLELAPILKAEKVKKHPAPGYPTLLSLHTDFWKSEIAPAVAAKLRTKDNVNVRFT